MTGTSCKTRHARERGDWAQRLESNMAAASEFPADLAARPLGLIALTGLDATNKPLHRAIWESFSVGRHHERLPLSFQLLSVDHEYPKAKAKVCEELEVRYSQ